MRRLLALFALPFLLLACADKPDPAPAYGDRYSTAADLANFEFPTVTPLENGSIVVRFKKTGCSFLFSHNGELLEGGRLCTDLDLQRARLAVKDYIVQRDDGIPGL
ncbi:MAG: hypothetical protein R3242_06320 [Akkermansiaceae bacterium]|nr:hypothetical protein [Akkermansiaceae bacterium]